MDRPEQDPGAPWQMADGFAARAKQVRAQLRAMIAERKQRRSGLPGGVMDGWIDREEREPDHCCHERIIVWNNLPLVCMWSGGESGQWLEDYSRYAVDWRYWQPAPKKPVALDEDIGEILVNAILEYRAGQSTRQYRGVAPAPAVAGLGICAQCNKALTDSAQVRTIVERGLSKTYWLCSDACVKAHEAAVKPSQIEPETPRRKYYNAATGRNE